MNAHQAAPLGVFRVGLAAVLALALALAGCGGTEPASDATARALAVRTPNAANVVAGEATESVFTEAGKLVRADENVASLGDALFGDRVNLYDGTLEFVQTDVSLPGNGPLPATAPRPVCRRTSGSTSTTTPVAA